MRIGDEHGASVGKVAVRYIVDSPAVAITTSCVLCSFPCQARTDGGGNVAHSLTRSR
jgi:hypothetical protein